MWTSEKNAILYSARHPYEVIMHLAISAHWERKGIYDGCCWHANRRIVLTMLACMFQCQASRAGATSRAVPLTGGYTVPGVREREAVLQS